MYPAGDAAMDPDDCTDITADIDAGNESKRPGTGVAQHNSSLAFNPLFDEVESSQVDAAEQEETQTKESGGAAHSCLRMTPTLHTDTQCMGAVHVNTLCVCALFSSRASCSDSSYPPREYASSFLQGPSLLLQRLSPWKASYSMLLSSWPRPALPR